MTVSAAFCNSWITLKNGFGLVARKWPSLRICLHFSSATYFMWGQQVDFSCCMILKSSDRSAFDYLILILASVSPLAVWQRVGRERMIHAISCLVNTPGTRLTLNTLMPACPFYQPRATSPVFTRGEELDHGFQLFFLAEPSLCFRVSVGSPGPVTGRRAPILILGCLCVTLPVFWPQRGKGKLCPVDPPPSCQACCKTGKPALKQPTQGNLGFICFCPTQKSTFNVILYICDL